MSVKGIMIAIILLVVTIIIIFTFIGNSSSDLINAADSITDANNCSKSLSTDPDGLLTYNITDKYCYNVTGEQVYVAGQYDLPLNTLFSSSGVALLVLMAAILIFVVILVLKFAKKK